MGIGGGRGAYDKIDEISNLFYAKVVFDNWKFCPATIKCRPQPIIEGNIPILFLGLKRERHPIFDTIILPKQNQNS